MSYIESVIERADALVHAVSSSDVVGISGRGKMAAYPVLSL